jgi:hypothetical protein
MSIVYFLAVLLTLPLLLLLSRACQLYCCCRKKVGREGAYTEVGAEQEMAAMNVSSAAARYQRGFDDDLEDDDEL